jgi:hypothetical protein
MSSTKASVPIGAAEIPVHFEIELPGDTPDYMAPAYFGCLQWALGNTGILNEFTKDTGKVFSPARGGLALMIDEATRFEPHQDFLQAFVPWFNEWVWGKMDGSEGE